MKVFEKLLEIRKNKRLLISIINDILNLDQYKSEPITEKYNITKSVYTALTYQYDFKAAWDREFHGVKPKDMIEDRQKFITSTPFTKQLVYIDCLHLYGLRETSRIYSMYSKEIFSKILFNKRWKCANYVVKMYTDLDYKF